VTWLAASVNSALLAFVEEHMSLKFYGLYLSFSGESTTPISNVYALSPMGEIVSKAVLDPVKSPYQELRGMSFGPDGNLYVAQAYKKASLILKFSGTPANGSTILKYMGEFVTPSASAGLSHPYQPVFSPDGDLFVSSQDTNVVTAFYGPKSLSSGRAMPDSKFLAKRYAGGTFNPGTFAPAHTAKPGAPNFTSVATDQGGLTFKTLPSDSTDSADKSGTSGTHSVRGLAFDKAGNLYVADEGNDRVAVFGTDGMLVGVITGSKNHFLSAPVALCFDGSKTLYIGSPGNKSLFSYDVSRMEKKDFEAHVFVSDAKELEKLSGVAVDSDGTLYTGQREIKKKSNDQQSGGKKIYKWSSRGTPSTFAGPFEDSPEQVVAVHAPLVG
jgi:glucose/arabinose dehydrogenase